MKCYFVARKVNPEFAPIAIYFTEFLHYTYVALLLSDTGFWAAFTLVFTDVAGNAYSIVYLSGMDKETIAMAKASTAKARERAKSLERRATAMRIAHVGRRNFFCFGTALRKAPAPGCETLTKRTVSRTDAPCRSSSSFLHSVWWDSTDVHTSQQVGDGGCSHPQSTAGSLRNLLPRCLDHSRTGLHHIQHRASQLVCAVCGRQLNHNR